MKITFLGTGTSTGIPMIACHCPTCLSDDVKDKRLRSSILIQAEGLNITVDCGADFRQQMLTQKIQKLDAVLMTHGHRDHTGGIDDIRAFNFIHKKDIDFYLNVSTAEILKKHYDYAFDAENQYASKPKLQLKIIGNEKFTVQHKLEVIPIAAKHGNMEVLGFRIDNFTYITDANYISPNELRKIEGTEILVINALRWEKHASHFTVEEAIALAQSLKIDTTYFTHISHQMGKHADVEKMLPKKIFLAYDNLSIKTK